MLRAAVAASKFAREIGKTGRRQSLTQSLAAAGCSNANRSGAATMHHAKMGCRGEGIRGISAVAAHSHVNRAGAVDPAGQRGQLVRRNTQMHIPATLDTDSCRGLACDGFQENAQIEGQPRLSREKPRKRSS